MKLRIDIDFKLISEETANATAQNTNPMNVDVSALTDALEKLRENPQISSVLNEFDRMMKLATEKAQKQWDEDEDEDEK